MTRAVQGTRGEPVACTFCLYEMPAGTGLPWPVVPLAVTVAATVNGPRELCADHARRGTWGVP